MDSEQDNIQPTAFVRQIATDINYLLNEVKQRTAGGVYILKRDEAISVINAAIAKGVYSSENN